MFLTRLKKLKDAFSIILRKEPYHLLEHITKTRKIILLHTLVEERIGKKKKKKIKSQAGAELYCIMNMNVF